MRTSRGRIFRGSLTALLLAAAFAIVNGQGPASRPAADRPAARLADLFGSLPLYFIENQGQVDHRVGYYLHGGKASIFFTSDGVIFALRNPQQREESPFRPASDQAAEESAGWAVRLAFVGADQEARPVGAGRTEAIVSYFQGRPERWRAGVPTYAGVTYENLWPGIDLHYEGTSGKLKYTLTVAPGADPGRIRLAYDGASEVRLNEQGKLEIVTPVGGFAEEAPYVYQEIEGRRVEVAAAYEVANGVFGFRVAGYDRRFPLHIDPAVLIYSGYIGGASSDIGYKIAVDNTGSAYLVSETTSSDCPTTTGAFKNRPSGNKRDIYVAKVKADGTALVYAGYIGGAGADYPQDIALDSSKNAYIAGETTSTDFPKTTGKTCGAEGDGFVAKINAAGNAMVYARCIGGTNWDRANGVAVSSQGNAYVAGSTTSTDFPATMQPGLSGGADVFLVKLNAAGDALDYGRYIGGAGDDYGYGGVAVDTLGNAYTTGRTSSDDFPVTGGWPYGTYGGNNDAFVAKVGPTGNLVYSGYLGGSAGDQGLDVAVDSAGNAYLTGWTLSSNFPVTAGWPYPNYAGNRDAIVVKVNWQGTSLDYSGYLGGSDRDDGNAIAVGPQGEAYVIGMTQSDNFPYSGMGTEFQCTNKGAPAANGIVAKINAAGTAVVYSGCIGGKVADTSSPIDYGNGIAVDSSGNAYITGETQSSDFPVVGMPSSFNNKGGTDSFVAKIAEVSTCAYQVSPLSNSVGAAGGPGTATVTTSAGCAWTVTSNSAWITVTPPANRTGSGAAEYTVAANSTTSSRTGTLTIAGQTHTVTQAREAVSTPNTPAGATTVATGASNSYTTGGATSDLGHAVQYYFDWGDGTNSGWLATGVTSASHSWAQAGSYSVKVMARCASHTAIQSAWSGILTVGAESVSAPTTPSGTTNITPGTSYTYTTGGATSNLGHPVQYYFDWGDGTNSGWLATGVTSASHSWAQTGSYSVKAMARCATHTAIQSAWSNILTVGAEAVSAPTTPSGTTNVTPGTSYTYTTGGATSNMGHPVQYFFDWGDGTNSGWLASGVTSASHSWAQAGSYSVKAMARCATHTAIQSAWSGILTVGAESVSAPTTPSGTTNVTPGTSYTYTTGGSTSNLGHPVQYYFDWGDGTNSGWLATGVTSASHSWAQAGSYSVKVMARCASHTAIQSAWSGILTVGAESVSAPTTPSGTTNITPGTSYTYTTGGATSNMGHPVQYFFDWGDGTNSGWLATGVTSASHSWAQAGSYSVKAMARCATHTAIQSAWSNILTVGAEAVSAPDTPSGTTNITPGTSYTYTTGGSTSNMGHPVQYFFDWGDGTNSGWLPTGVTSASHSWAQAGSYSVKAMARCATHTAIQSAWSGILTVGAESVSAPTTPSGTTNITPGTSYTYTTGGATSNMGHPVQYFFDWGDGTNSGWLATGVTSASHSWAQAGSYSVKAMARCATHTAIQSAWSNILTVGAEAVSAPDTPSGTTNITPGTSYTYTTGGATSNMGHPVQYFFDWGDGTNSGWLATGVTSASHSWAQTGSYSVKAMARCATHTAIQSAWSNILTVGAEAVFAPDTPTGTVSVTPGTSYTYTTGGATSNLGHPVQYFFDWGDGTNSGWLATGVTSASHSWAQAGSYSVKAMARCATHNGVQSAWSGILTVSAEGVSAPNTPTGTANITPGTSYTYTTGGATSTLGHPVQYFFDWGDGTNSGWLATGVTSASHSWAQAGSYSVKAMARCATHTGVQSAWSGILTVGAESVSAPNTPSGTANITPGTSYTYTTGGATSNLGHPVQYFFDWGDGTNSGWLATGVTSASHSWASAGSYSVKAMARCATHSSLQSAWSGILTVGAEAVSAPGTPTGTANVAAGTSYSYATGGATSNFGHPVQYFFDWGDGTNSGWLATGVTSASHSWAQAGSYSVRAMARCATHTGIQSAWSGSLAVAALGKPGTPSNPSPANGATGVATTPALTWAAGSGAESHDVFFGTASSPPLVGNTTGASYAPGTLNAGTKYYWKVVAKNIAGSTTSATWSFTTQAVVAPPGAPSSPSPADGAAGVATTPTLGWTAGSGAASHDVYFGTASSPPFVSNTTGASYAPGTLNAGTKYYWRVVAKNSAGSTTSATWSFTTATVTYSISGKVTKGGAGLAGVTVTLTGGPGGTRTTSGTGDYSFTGLPAGGPYTVTPTLAGHSFSPASRTFNTLSSNQSGADFAAATSGALAVGVFLDGVWYLDMNANGIWEAGVDRQAGFGWAGTTQVVGDWNGDGKTEIGVFSDGAWYLDYNGNGRWDGTSVDRAYSFGWAGVTPMVGDWNGDGKTQIGVFSDGAWYLDYNGNGVWDGAAIDRAYNFGWAGVTPLVGDWSGDGKTKVGVFKDGAWYLDFNGNGLWEGTTTDRAYSFGWAGVTALVGDWTGDGKTKIAVFKDGAWYLDLNGNGVWEATIDRQAGFGWAGVTPLVGDWNGDGKTEIAVFSDGGWYLDFNGNGAWDGVGVDKGFTFGWPGVNPVTGKW